MEVTSTRGLSLQSESNLQGIGDMFCDGYNHDNQITNMQPSLNLPSQQAGLELKNIANLFLIKGGNYLYKPIDLWYVCVYVYVRLRERVGRSCHIPILINDLVTMVTLLISDKLGRSSIAPLNILVV
jgi:hypothetical protein